MSNPLLESFNTPFDTMPFPLVQPEHYLPAIENAIEEAKANVDEVVGDPSEPNFENTIARLEFASLRLNMIAECFFNLNSAETNDTIQKLAREISPKLTAFGNDILLNEELFERIQKVWNKRDEMKLNPEETMLLEKTYKSFVRNGANLSSEKKEKLRELDREIATTTLQFGENVLAETHDFTLVIENEADLAGLPDASIESAAEEAEQRGMKDKWVFTLDFPSYVPFITYAKNRELRREMATAYGKRAFWDNDHNNEETVLRIANLRHERANLLGFPTHAAFILEERMAEKPEKVEEFLQDLLKKALPAAKNDVQEVAEFAKKLDGIENLKRWDFAYYAEKLKKERFGIDDETLKPFFKLENVIDGVFKTANRLYGISFVERNDIPKYHPDVITYEVVDENGDFLSVLYADFFPRKGKRNGAWKTSYRSQFRLKGKDHRPHISIVCNFTKPTSSKPSLLTFNEVTTLFHEFGHALHGMLADSTYPGLSGTSVYWDFVELPSQIFENWCYEKECLDLFAKHYETGERIPMELVEKLKDSSTFLEGYQTVRQLGFGLLDMAWHNIDPRGVKNVSEHEDKALGPAQVIEKIPGTNISCSFGHIFQGGYSAGYYSYKWAEVLDADAFERFVEEGIFNPKVAADFRRLLSSGGTRHPMELFVEFRGREPKPEALLKRAGLLVAE